MSFCDYIYQLSEAAYFNKILLIDMDELEETEHYSNIFRENGFEITWFLDDLDFRINYEEKLKSENLKLLVFAKPETYIPYDILQLLKKYNVSYSNIYPRLNSDVLIKKRSSVDQNLLYSAYRNNYDNYTDAQATENFIQKVVLGKDNIAPYAEAVLAKLINDAEMASTYKDWFGIADEKAKLDVLSVEHEISIDTAELNRKFQSWAILNFGKQSTIVDKNSPVLVSKAMDYMKEHSSKFVVIVMDGMSEFDWRVLSQSFLDINYKKTSCMAMIPTVTSISRQCLLSNKYPVQLENPWHQSKEKLEFISCAKDLGYKESQIDYQRGYKAQFDDFIHCGAVIIMDIDENVHGQKQGRLGMFNDISVMSKQHQLADLTAELLEKGFDVYITADHGNTPCIGLGRNTATGVETETKSHRMLVLKDFADKKSKIDKYGMFEYPGYYLPKEFEYLICDTGTSLDTKDEVVMSHGGITIDEVIVPFISIKAEENNE